MVLKVLNTNVLTFDVLTELFIERSKSIGLIVNKEKTKYMDIIAQ